jgi:hypothetical protein
MTNGSRIGRVCTVVFAFSVYIALSEKWRTYARKLHDHDQRQGVCHSETVAATALPFLSGMGLACDGSDLRRHFILVKSFADIVYLS